MELIGLLTGHSTVLSWMLMKLPFTCGLRFSSGRSTNIGSRSSLSATRSLLFQQFLFTSFLNRPYFWLTKGCLVKPEKALITSPRLTGRILNSTRTTLKNQIALVSQSWIPKVDVTVSSDSGLMNATMTSTPDEHLTNTGVVDTTSARYFMR